jgi:hypothetical protein
MAFQTTPARVGQPSDINGLRLLNEQAGGTFFTFRRQLKGFEVDHLSPYGTGPWYVPIRHNHGRLPPTYHVACVYPDGTVDQLHEVEGGLLDLGTRDLARRIACNLSEGVGIIEQARWA